MTVNGDTDRVEMWQDSGAHIEIKVSRPFGVYVQVIPDRMWTLLPEEIRWLFVCTCTPEETTDGTFRPSGCDFCDAAGLT